MNILNKLKKTSQFKKNVFSGTFLAGLHIILLLIAYPLYIRYLGIERYGLWALISVVISFSQMGDLGINEAIIKYTAEEYGKKKFQEIESYITTAILILIIPSLLIIAALTIFNKNILDLLGLTADLRQEVKYLIPLFGVLTSLIFYSNIIWGALKGVGRVDLANYLFSICSLLQILISVILIILGLGIWGLFLGNLFLYIFLFILCLLILKKVFKLSIFKVSYFDIRKTKRLIKFGGAMFGSKVIAMLLDPFNRIIITRFIGLSAVAYYDISLKVVKNIRSLFQMGLYATMPKVSELNSGDVNPNLKISNIYSKGIRFILFFSLPLFAIIFIMGRPILNLWLGDNYNFNILISLRFFLVAYFINLLSVPAYYLFMGLGKVRICFYHIIIQSLFNTAFIGFIIFFTKKIDFVEVVLVCSISLIISAIYILIQFKIFEKRVLKLN
jgi:O-antigen/teichoic acid export membrane protein